MVHVTPYDYAIIDEVRAVTGQMLSHTNGKKFGTHATIYYHVLNSARKGTVLLDADLEADGMVHGLVNELWTPEQQLVCRYTHVALQRTIAPVDKTSWYSCVNRDVQAGHKLFLVFRGQKEMRSWIDAQLKRGDFSYLAVDGTTSEEELAGIWEGHQRQRPRRAGRLYYLQGDDGHRHTREISPCLRSLRHMERSYRS
jgi:hypothetical protein